MRLPNDLTLGVVGAVMVLTCFAGKAGNLPALPAFGFAADRPAVAASVTTPEWALLSTESAAKESVCDAAQ